MRIGLVVDSTCDLPQSFIEENKIVILPISIRVDQDIIVDNRESEPALDFYRYQIGAKGHDAESIPFSMDQIKDLFLTQLVIDWDYVICESVMRTRSPIFENATKASFAILSGYKSIRQKAGVEGPFTMRVIDSRTLFAGQGALAAETVRLIKSGMAANDVRARVEKLTGYAYAYGVPPDLYYIRARAQKKGDKSVSWMSAALGSALDIKPILRAHQDNTEPVAKLRGFEHAVEAVFKEATKHVQQGLLAPFVVVSYAGEPEKIREFPGYVALERATRERGVQLLTCVMGVTGGVNLGPGTVTVGFIANPHTFGQ